MAVVCRSMLKTRKIRLRQRGLLNVSNKKHGKKTVIRVDLKKTDYAS